MILDILENYDQYKAVNSGFEKGFEFLNRKGLDRLSPGRYDIDGAGVFGIVAKDPGRKKHDAFLEIHKRYIDIQLILEGVDEMGWKPRADCQNPIDAYNSETDLQFFKDKPDIWVNVKPGAFAIFFPEDAHIPLIADTVIHKVIIKVAVDF